MRCLVIFSLVRLVLAEGCFGQERSPRELFFSAPGSPVKVTPGAKAKPPVTAAAKGGGANLVLAAVGSPAPLGLRYSILLSRDNGEYREVKAETVFRSGDRLKIQVEANTGAYLYVVARGSSGNWSVLFPASEVENGSNFVTPFRPYAVPATGRFYFDDQPGVERLFLVLARKPEAHLEDLIYRTNPPGQPVSPGTRAPAKELQLAQLTRPIDDQLVGRVRSSVAARDLVFEAVDETKPLTPERNETARYVINNSAAPEAKLIVDLTLQHR
jgi:hypothetical protein